MLLLMLPASRAAGHECGERDEAVLGVARLDKGNAPPLARGPHAAAAAASVLLLLALPRGLQGALEAVQRRRALHRRRGVHPETRQRFANGARPVVCGSERNG